MSRSAYNPDVIGVINTELHDVPNNDGADI